MYFVNCLKQNVIIIFIAYEWQTSKNETRYLVQKDNPPIPLKTL